MMNKCLLILLILLSTSKLALTQDFPYGNISDEELNMKKYDKDTSVHAVVLQEFGSSKILNLGLYQMRLIFEYHVKIKIFDSKAFDYGTIGIKFYNSENNSLNEEVDSVVGITYFKEENGLTNQVLLEPKNIFTIRNNKYQSTVKFAMPKLNDGCVIEYRYRLESPFFFNNFRPWEFQSVIPKIHSEYEAHIPASFTYNATLLGPFKLTKNKLNVDRSCFMIRGSRIDCSDIVFGMDDIPAFIAEDYMTSPKNFVSAITFNLEDYIDPYTRIHSKPAKEWSDIDHLLKNNQAFGIQLKKNLFKERISSIIADKPDEVNKARAVYAYLQKWFKWNNYIGIYSSDGIKKALDSHQGSIADINISLIAALNSAGVNTEAVLLSTRDNGFVNYVYPTLSDFNYIIAKANIGGKSYLLDASDPLLGFNMLPLKCLNDRGRVFSPDKPSYWIDLNLPQKKKNTYTLDLTLHDDGKLKGTITNYSIGYQSYEKRKVIKKFNNTGEYVEQLDNKWRALKILKSEITNLDSLDLPLGEKYEVEIDLHKNDDNNRLIFNPFFLNKIDTNPFKSNERLYPVDWGMSSDERYILTLHFPAKYTIEIPPQIINITMPNDGGKYLTNYEPDDNSFTFSQIIQFNKSIYSAKEYPYLKEIYNKIIQAEKAEIVFKKK